MWISKQKKIRATYRKKKMCMCKIYISLTTIYSWRIFSITSWKQQTLLRAPLKCWLSSRSLPECSWCLCTWIRHQTQGVGPLPLGGYAHCYHLHQWQNVLTAWGGKDLFFSFLAKSWKRYRDDWQSHSVYSGRTAVWFSNFGLYEKKQPRSKSAPLHCLSRCKQSVQGIFIEWA